MDGMHPLNLADSVEGKAELKYENLFSSAASPSPRRHHHRVSNIKKDKKRKKDQET